MSVLYFSHLKGFLFFYHLRSCEYRFGSGEACPVCISSPCLKVVVLRKDKQIEEYHISGVCF